MNARAFSSNRYHFMCNTINTLSLHQLKANITIYTWNYTSSFPWLYHSICLSWMLNFIFVHFLLFFIRQSYLYMRRHPNIFILYCKAFSSFFLAKIETFWRLVIHTRVLELACVDVSGPSICVMCAYTNPDQWLTPFVENRIIATNILKKKTSSTSSWAFPLKKDLFSSKEQMEVLNKKLKFTTI